ncbi:MAG: heme exporter protein CcmD [Burkholderiales bacterium]
MNWGSPAEFFAMGGYAFYVWGSFGMCALVIAAETFLVARGQNVLLRQLRKEVVDSVKK